MAKTIWHSFFLRHGVYPYYAELVLEILTVSVYKLADYTTCPSHQMNLIIKTRVLLQNNNQTVWHIQLVRYH